MDRNKRNRRHHNWNNQKNNSSNKTQNEKPFALRQKVFQFNKKQYEDPAAESQRLQSIVELKAREVICPKCGKRIDDVAGAIHDKTAGAPVHFDCVMAELQSKEKLEQNEKIAYIGQGRFGILYFENPRDQRKFTIKKIIEVEDRDTKPEWREEFSGLYSKIQ
ncbi:MAG: hypothetical protein MJ181_00610 [Treponema sp.]|nr:hypothetical protein [Treponema sp.]